MAKIHPLSVVDSHANIADDVVIGPFCYVEGKVTIGAGTVLDSHVTIKDYTTLGERNFVSQGTVLGGPPQDRKFKGEESYLVIGNDNVLREYVTIHRASGLKKSTILGDDNMIMGFVHFGHNVVLDSHITVANGVNLAGHVTVEDHVVIGGLTGVHQFARIGRVAMVGGMARISRDPPPYMITGGVNGEVLDINAVGLRRYGISSDSRMALHKACKLLYKSQLGLKHAVEIIRKEVPETDEVKYLLAFEENRSSGKHGRGYQP